MFINFAQGFVIPPFWKIEKESVGVNQNKAQYYSDANPMGVNQYVQCPVAIKFQDETKWWNFPFDPVLSVSGGNNIILTDVLKQDDGNNARRGSIKEVWSQKDYEIQIAGVFISGDEELDPWEDIQTLRKYCEARKIVDVNCALLQNFGIQRLAIESYEFAHTAGIENQQFSIKAYSDDDFSLFVKR